MNLIKHSKKLHKFYLKSGQHLYVDSLCLMDGKSDFCVDFCAVNPKTKEQLFLFGIRTFDYFISFESSFSLGLVSVRSKKFYKNVFDSILAASSPYYMNQTFTLSRFGSISEDDVLMACRYFTRTVLDDLFIFNIDVVAFDRKGKKK